MMLLLFGKKAKVTKECRKSKEKDSMKREEGCRSCSTLERQKPWSAGFQEWEWTSLEAAGTAGVGQDWALMSGIVDEQTLS